MKTPIRQTFIFNAGLTILVLFLFWMTLAPSQLGGWVTYVIVDGNSMEPDFRRGDLVLVRSEPAYGVGDAVVYRDPQLGGYVFHRIIGMELDHLILQGDNNSWLDSYQPVRDEIVGRLWLHVPKLGTAIEWMRVPLHMSLLAGLLGAILMFDIIPNSSRQKRAGGAGRENFGLMPETALYALGLLAMVFLASGIFAFTRPLNQPAENIPYTQEGQYVYSATGTPGVYDTDVVRAGEPVFPKLTCFLNIGFTYGISGGKLQEVAGSHRMYARILDEQSGWQRTIPLTADTPFAGNTFFNTAALDLCQIESLVNLVEEQAGLKQTFYKLEIITEATFTAQADGIQIRDSFSPVLTFKYNKINFYVESAEPAGDPLYSSRQGLAAGAGLKPNAISLLGLKIPVWLVRFLSLVGFGLSVYGLVVAGLNLYRTASQSQEALIRLKYAGMLVDVYEQNVAPTDSVIDMTSMEDLARLAERLGLMILHMRRNFLHYYFVQSHGVTYRYVITTGRAGIPAFDSPAPEPESEPENFPQPVSSTSDIVSSSAFDTSSVEITSPRMADRKEKKIYVYVPSRDEMPPAQPRDHDALPVAEDEIEYVIQTNEIEFAAPEEGETILRKIRL